MIWAALALGAALALLLARVFEIPRPPRRRPVFPTMQQIEVAAYQDWLRRKRELDWLIEQNRRQ